MTSGNLFSNLPAALPAELFEELLSADGFKLERIVSLGHATPPGEWYDQEWHEWVVLLSGSARLKFEDESEVRTLAPGDYVLIPAHRRHRVEWTSVDKPTVWLALHFRPAVG